MKDCEQMMADETSGNERQAVVGGRKRWEGGRGAGKEDGKGMDEEQNLLIKMKMLSVCESFFELIFKFLEL
jgi:hypothetical protein